MIHFRKYLFILLGFLMVLQGCQRTTIYEPEELAHITKVWFNCIECNEGQIQDVIRLGPQIIPFMKKSVLQGPSMSAQVKYLIQCRNVHFIASNCEASSDPYGSNIPDSQSCALSERKGFCYNYLKNYVNKYKSRAAIILSEIGDEEELDFLTEFLGKLDGKQFPNLFRDINLSNLKLKRRIDLMRQ